MNGVIVANKEKTIFSKVKYSYTYRYIKRIISLLCTIILALLLVVGALMFYYSIKSKEYEKKGVKYTPPFGLYTIISGSMEPNIKVYDVILVSDVDDLSTIRVGDVITFISTWDLNLGKTVTHRVVSITKTLSGEFQFTTKGDANGSSDGTVVMQENLVGKVQLRIPQLGRIQFLLANKAAWLIAVFIPAMAVIIFDIVKVIKLHLIRERLNNIKIYRPNKE